jgi:hypothetical protein
MFKTFKDFENFTITKIYKGKDNCCRCGCGGKYYYPDNRSFKRILKNAEKVFNENLKLSEENLISIFGETERFQTMHHPNGSGWVNIPVLDEMRPKLNQCYCIYYDEMRPKVNQYHCISYNETGSKEEGLINLSIQIAEELED